MAEIYKDIPNYIGVYQVSNLGNVKSLEKRITRSDNIKVINKEFIRKKTINSYGYETVCLRKEGKKRVMKVHQLVMMAFKGYIPKGRMIVINHKNFIRDDNRLENLEIVTARENGNKKHLKSSSKYTGVSWSKDKKKWRAYIHIEGVLKHLGYYHNESNASLAYKMYLKNI